MQLLHGSPLAAPEFASLSILLKPSTAEATSVTMGEPMMLASPVATVSSSQSLEALKQLHGHVTLILRAASDKQAKTEKLATDLFKEDEKQLDEMQIFRPLLAHGVGLHYRLIRGDNTLVAKLSALILGSNKSTASAVGNVPSSEIWGIVFCVGVSGLPYAHGSSPLQYSLWQRMNQCTTLLTKAGAKDLAGIKILLSTFLLSDDESRVANEMAEATNLVLLPEPDETGAKGGMSPMGIMKSKKQVAKGGSSLVDSGVALSLAAGSAEAARVMTQRLTVMSSAETDTFLRRYNVSGQERKANLDLTAGKKSKFRRRKSDARDPDFDNFDYKGAAKDGEFQSQPTDAMSQAMPALAKAGQKLQLRQPKKDTRAKASGGLMAPRNDGPSSRHGSGFGDAAESVSSGGFMGDDAGSRTSLSNAFGKKAPRRASTHFTGEDEEAHTFVGESSTVAGNARIQVNIALNEDLACSYRQSQLSSCSVEGVVQIQVKSSVQTGIPFYLYMRDVSMHIASLQDNKKFAEDLSESLAHGDEDADHKFAVTVPNSDSYFPVLRYKCVPDLGPVPIRVQTRAKVDGEFCRVALQISSNPNNEASLTDLTISMGVPDDVVGESLVTQPAGGVWEESKKSVIWCVSELGEGEKFQLQVRFEMASDNPAPDFPVLVRAQCLFSQLSDIELEVTDIPDVYPADISVKLARRFRLAHRERS